MKLRVKCGDCNASQEISDIEPGMWVKMVHECPDGAMTFEVVTEEEAGAT